MIFIAKDIILRVFKYCYISKFVIRQVNMIEISPNQEYLKSLAISDNGFLFDVTTGQTYTLNSIAHEIIRKLQDGHKPSEILQSLLDEYDVSKDDAERDLEYFIVQLKEHGLLGV